MTYDLPQQGVRFDVRFAFLITKEGMVDWIKIWREVMSVVKAGEVVKEGMVQERLSPSSSSARAQVDRGRGRTLTIVTR
jgi:hypothetical protein